MVYWLTSSDANSNGLHPTNVAVEKSKAIVFDNECAENIYFYGHGIYGHGIYFYGHGMDES